jgi:nucleoid-associated protein YgaU
MRLTGSGNWRAVYELNKDAIGPNPNYLEPGTVLIIPDAVSEERDDDS